MIEVADVLRRFADGYLSAHGAAILPSHRRAIADIQKITFASRFNETDELQIRLKTSLDQALLADWRRLPIWRLLMKLPWTMTYDNVVRIPLAPFGPPPDDIQRQFFRLWKHFR